MGKVLSIRFQAVLEETRRFRAALPRLMSGPLAGQWVVFKDGRVHSTHPTEDEAYRAGLLKFGRLGGHVIDRVEEKYPAPLTAAVSYG